MTSAQWADELRLDGHPAVLDLGETAKILRVCKSRVRAYRDQGLIHSIHPAGSGRQILFARTEVARYLANAH